MYDRTYENLLQFVMKRSGAQLDVMSKGCLTTAKISWQSKFLYNREGASITLSFMIFFPPTCLSRTVLVWNLICPPKPILSQGHSFQHCWGAGLHHTRWNCWSLFTAIQRSCCRWACGLICLPGLPSLWQHPLLSSQGGDLQAVSLLAENGMVWLWCCEPSQEGVRFLPV